jgi:hypothetical protein
MEPRNSEQSFRWIVGLLNELHIPFEISGGLAAKVYGSQRPLNDIDIDIPEDKFDDLYNQVKEFVTFGPGRLKDERWDVMLMTLNHHGQEIDISGAYDCRICDARTGEWVEAPVDLSACEKITIFGIEVPVIARDELVKYKLMLAGEHQQEDINAVLER